MRTSKNYTLSVQRCPSIYLCSFNFLCHYVNIWAAFCLRKNQAIRLYLFLASAKIPQRFSSRRRLLLHHTRNKKDTASILCRVQRMPSMASAEHEFACRKLTALTGGQWFTAKSSLQCKLEVKECTGRTFFNDDIRVSDSCQVSFTNLTT